MTDQDERLCRTAVPRFAVIGTHNAGKTSLVLAAVSLLRRMGIEAGVTLEASRSSLYLAAGWRGYDSQLDLFSRTVAAEMESARAHDVVLCDRSLIDVLAYTALLEAPQTEAQVSVLQAMHCFTREYVRTYRRLFVPTWHFDMTSSTDPLRKGDAAFQAAVSYQVDEIATQLAVPVTPIPDAETGAEFVADEVAGDLTGRPR